MNVFNRPHVIPLVDYDIELEKYINQVKNTPGVVSVMTMGSVTKPGLSDLDVICVVQDNFLPHYSSQLSVKSLRKDIFLHGPIIFPESLIHKLQYIIYATNLVEQWGKPLIETIIQPSETTQKHLALAYLIDFSESRLLQYSMEESLGSLNQRAWITRLWSLTHTQSICKKLHLDLSPSSTKIIDEIRELRNNWFDQPPSEKYFIYLFQQSKLVIQEALIKGIEMGYKKTNSKKLLPKEFISGRKSIVCSNELSNPDANTMCIEFLKLKRCYTRTVAPTVYAHHLKLYGFRPIKNNYLPEIPLHPNHIKTLKERASLIRIHTKYLMAKNITFSMKGYLGLSPVISNGYRRFIDIAYWHFRSHLL